MNDFILMNKIKELNMYTEQYIFASFPKKDLALKIRLEQNLYLLVELTIKANVNKGNIRSKYQTHLISTIYLIKKKRFTAFMQLLTEIKKISIKWKDNEKKEEPI